ncbi:MAG: hypothetical protein ACO3I4_03375 [Candidatus Kapaibacteriota bacterium]
MLRTSLRIVLLLVVSLFAIVTTATTVVMAQPQAVTRVEGKITDEVTGSPVECKLYIYDPAGKRIRTVSSNSTDGSYLTVLNEAGTYKFSLGGHNVHRKDYSVVVPKSAVFQEVKQDFTVREFKQGTQLYSGVAFDRGSATLNASAQQALTALKTDLETNQQLQVVVRVSSDPGTDLQMKTAAIRTYLADSLEWAKSMKVYEKKYKKTKKNQQKPEPPVAPVRPVVALSGISPQANERRAALQAFFTDVRNGELRIVYELVSPAAGSATVINEAAILAELTSKKKKATSPAPAPVLESNLTVVIGEVKRLFGN